MYQVKSKQGVSPDDFAKAKDTLQKQILEEKQSTAFEAFHDALQKRYEEEGKLAYNGANLKQLLNQSSS